LPRIHFFGPWFGGVERCGAEAGLDQILPRIFMDDADDTDGEKMGFSAAGGGLAFSHALSFIRPFHLSVQSVSSIKIRG
jgi:hypothetical protein